jgi:excisionase family DNA binding protein
MALHPPRERTAYTPSEVAGMIRLSRRTIIDWARTGRIEAFRTPGRQWRIPAAAAHRMFQEQEPSDG